MFSIKSVQQFNTKISYFKKSVATDMTTNHVTLEQCTYECLETTWQHDNVFYLGRWIVESHGCTSDVHFFTVERRPVEQQSWVTGRRFVVVSTALVSGTRRRFSVSPSPFLVNLVQQSPFPFPLKNFLFGVLSFGVGHWFVGSGRQKVVSRSPAAVGGETWV